VATARKAGFYSVAHYLVLSTGFDATVKALQDAVGMGCGGRAKGAALAEALEIASAMGLQEEVRFFESLMLGMQQLSVTHTILLLEMHV
jgi:hypothetical protein